MSIAFAQRIKALEAALAEVKQQIAEMQKAPEQSDVEKRKPGRPPKNVGQATDQRDRGL